MAEILIFCWSPQVLGSTHPDGHCVQRPTLLTDVVELWMCDDMRPLCAHFRATLVLITRPPFVLVCHSLFARTPNSRLFVLRTFLYYYILLLLLLSSYALSSHLPDHCVPVFFQLHTQQE